VKIRRKPCSCNGPPPRRRSIPGDLELHGAAQSVIHAIQRNYTDGSMGNTVFTYHAKIGPLTPHTSYRYSVTRTMNSHLRNPFTATFHTHPGAERRSVGRATADLATPNTAWVMSSPQSRHAVDAVERFERLFHISTAIFVRN